MGGGYGKSHFFALELCLQGHIGILRHLLKIGLPPPRGNFVDHIFLKAHYLAMILQYVSLLTMAA